MASAPGSVFAAARREYRQATAEVPANRAMPSTRATLTLPGTLVPVRPPV